MNSLVIHSPLDGKKLGSVAVDTAASLQEKVEMAHKVQPAWESLGVKRRAQVFFRYRHLLHENFERIAQSIHLENGKTLGEAKAELEKAIEVTEFAISMPQVMINQNLEVSQGIQCTMVYRPLGVVASICPFNFPVMIPHWTVPIALMSGNAMVLKPSDKVPLSSQIMLELLLKAGVPEGVFQVVNGGRDVVEALCDAPGIEAVSFVGSTPVATSVYRRASSHLKRALCLGGAKNHLILLPDADPEMSASDIVASFTGMAGQRCMAASVLVAVGDCEAILQKIVDKARALVCGETLGPIITKESYERIVGLIGGSVKAGATLRLDGRGVTVKGCEKGYYIGATVIDQVTLAMDVWKEEIFGPVLSIVRAKSLEEAVAIQNQNSYGNGASVYTHRGDWAEYAQKHLQAGMIGTNIGVPVPREPFSFGGVKASKFGVGDITGESSIDFWTQRVKLTTKWHASARRDWMS